MKKFSIKSSKFLIKEEYCKVEEQIVELPDGSEGIWYVTRSSDAVVVIPILSNGQVVLQKNYKHGSGEVVTEFCAGMIDDGENPIDAAIRELREETGYSSSNLTKIGEVFANPTSTDMKYHFFVARDCVLEHFQDLDESEQIEVFLVENIEEAKKVLTDVRTNTSSSSVAALGFVT